MINFRRNKYGNKKTTLDGYTFDSKKEAMYYLNLKQLKQKGTVLAFDIQPTFKFPMGFSYRADFKIIWANGKSEIIDVKGMKTAIYKLKLKCLKYFYPDINFREV